LNAREYAEEAANRRKFSVEERKRVRDEQSQRRAQAAEEAEEARDENAPSSHHYPPAVRAGFLHGCSSSSGHEDSACACALKRIEAKVSLGRYRGNEREIDEGRPLPITYSIQYGYCVGSEAAEGG
jgi:hypothetical protein